MADYSKLTKKELLYTLFARDLMLEERRKENDLQKATINTLIEDHRASQEWYKMQLADTEAQNKRVLEKLDIIVRSNQELEQKLAESEKSNEYFADRVEKADKEIKENYRNYNKLVEEYNELKQQLAEKEKENTKLKEVVDCVDKLKQFNANMKDYALVNRDVADDIYCEHQDKISFCIEQLEKVRKFAEDMWGIYKAEEDIEEFIKDQIKQLKEMPDEK